MRKRINITILLGSAALFSQMEAEERCYALQGEELTMCIDKEPQGGTSFEKVLVSFENSRSGELLFASDSFVLGSKGRCIECNKDLLYAVTPEPRVGGSSPELWGGIYNYNPISFEGKIDGESQKESGHVRIGVSVFSYSRITNTKVANKFHQLVKLDENCSRS